MKRRSFLGGALAALLVPVRYFIIRSGIYRGVTTVFVPKGHRVVIRGATMEKGAELIVKVKP